VPCAVERGDGESENGVGMGVHHLSMTWYVYGYARAPCRDHVARDVHDVHGDRVRNGGLGEERHRGRRWSWGRAHEYTLRVADGNTVVQQDYLDQNAHAWPNDVPHDGSSRTQIDSRHSKPDDDFVHGGARSCFR
jgi:hypothetical protein